MTRRNYRCSKTIMRLCRRFTRRAQWPRRILASTEVKLLAQLAPRSVRSSSSHDKRQMMWLPASVYQPNFLPKRPTISGKKLGVIKFRAYQQQQWKICCNFYLSSSLSSQLRPCSRVVKRSEISRRFTETSKRLWRVMKKWFEEPFVMSGIPKRHFRLAGTLKGHYRRWINDGRSGH